MYNDETPGGLRSTTKAHAKGVLGFTGLQGFWLIHSMPKFPVSPISGSYEGLASGQSVYGQSAMCISLSNVDAVGRLLLMSNPLIYASRTAGVEMESLPSLSRLLKGPVRTPAESSLAVPLLQQPYMIGFAKHRAAGMRGMGGNGQFAVPIFFGSNTSSPTAAGWPAIAVG